MMPVTPSIMPIASRTRSVIRGRGRRDHRPQDKSGWAPRLEAQRAPHGGNAFAHAEESHPGLAGAFDVAGSSVILDGYLDLLRGSIGRRGARLTHLETQAHPRRAGVL